MRKPHKKLLTVYKDMFIQYKKMLKLNKKTFIQYKEMLYAQQCTDLTVQRNV